MSRHKCSLRRHHAVHWQLLGGVLAEEAMEH